MVRPLSLTSLESLRVNRILSGVSTKTLIFINFLNESIAIDSSFAPAYVTLSEAYITLNKFINNNDEKPVNRERSRSAINKALELDNTLGAAFISSSAIEKELKLKTLEIIQIENIKITRTLSIITNKDSYPSKALEFFYNELLMLKNISK